MGALRDIEKDRLLERVFFPGCLVNYTLFPASFSTEARALPQEWAYAWQLYVWRKSGKEVRNEVVLFL